ncbi:competence protein ComFB [Gleimia hominis]|uniref:competence protein ComFB n=1 Tax=Gleimia hominis TaxID=595468 RepID=UPI000C7FC1CC|nr:competence protein ComFB [Gleimia hominis]WIK65063.1 competence protein ComFB [Gleimia hominis]
MESADYLKRIDSLENEVASLKDVLLTLVGCVQYSADKPYDAYLCRMFLSNTERVNLTLILGGITTRLKGEKHSAKPKAPLADNASLMAAYDDEPMSVPEAIDLLSQVVGSANAAGVLTAFNQQYQNGLEFG